MSAVDRDSKRDAKRGLKRAIRAVKRTARRGNADGEIRTPGRPRSEEAHQAILKSVMALIGEGETFADLSMEKVAARAGVGKATIYRRWANMEALLLDALGASKQPLPSPPGRSVREDLLLCLGAMTSAEHNPLAQIFNARSYAALLTEGIRNPDFIRRYRAEVIEPRREILRRVLRRGVTSGELRADLDIDAAHAMLTAPLLLRMVSMQPGEKLPANLVGHLVETALAGMAATKR